ncbi:hypothetical protein, partial [[Eubacterium] cellulosolvens]
MASESQFSNSIRRSPFSPVRFGFEYAGHMLAFFVHLKSLSLELFVTSPSACSPNGSLPLCVILFRQSSAKLTDGLLKLTYPQIDPIVSGSPSAIGIIS